MNRLLDVYKCLALTAIAGILAYGLWGKRPVRVAVVGEAAVHVGNESFEPIPVQIERN